MLVMFGIMLYVATISHGLLSGINAIFIVIWTLLGLYTNHRCNCCDDTRNDRIYFCCKKILSVPVVNDVTKKILTLSLNVKENSKNDVGIEYESYTINSLKSNKLTKLIPKKTTF